MSGRGRHETKTTRAVRLGIVCLIVLQMACTSWHRRSPDQLFGGDRVPPPIQVRDSTGAFVVLEAARLSGASLIGFDTRTPPPDRPWMARRVVLPADGIEPRVKGFDFVRAAALWFGSSLIFGMAFGF